MPSLQLNQKLAYLRSLEMAFQKFVISGLKRNLKELLNVGE